MELSFGRIGSARAVLIAGPTASGKSAAALALATEAMRAGRTAWIVNADAMQVYAGLRVLTARPGPDEESRVPHRLYGHVPPSVRYSVGAWRADIAAVLEEARTIGALVIAVGGTGLYFKALTEGLAAIPDIPADVRTRWSDRLQAEGAPALHAELARLDPSTAAGIRMSDPQRILRALEVLEVAGQPLSDLQQAASLPPLVTQGEARAFVLDVNREELYRRIDHRFDRMVGEGGLEEVDALVARNLDPNLPAMKAIGVREFASMLRGEVTLQAAVAKAKMESRRYAKRQITWFRNQMRDWPRISAS